MMDCVAVVLLCWQQHLLLFVHVFLSLIKILFWHMAIVVAVAVAVAYM